MKTKTVQTQCIASVTKLILFALTGIISGTFNCLAQTTLVIQPDAAAGKDAYCVWDQPSGNYGTSTQLLVGNAYNYEDGIYEDANGYIQFDLSGIPPSQQITSATLELYVFYRPVTLAWDIYRVTGAWTEGGLTYSNQPATADYITTATPTAIGWVSFDIKTAVENWYSGSWTNNGLRLSTNDLTGQNAAYSSDNAANRPKLTINYTVATPIELLSFGATPVKDTNGKYYIRCEWSTASEINNDYFSIERGTEDGGRGTKGMQFQQIGTMRGAGNSIVTLNYEFIDAYPFQGTSYYRLKQTDYDGSFSYSNIVSVYIGGINLISIAPNPVKDKFEYTIGSTETTVAQVTVIDVLGQTVINTTETIEKGVTKKQLDISQLASGTYLLSINTDNLGKTEKQFAVR